MKQRMKRKMVMGVWLLLAVFVTPFVVQSVHTHPHSHVCEGGTGQKTGNDCPVCHFAFSSFDETRPTDVHCAVLFRPLTLAVYHEKISFQPLSSPYLRGPPPVYC
jgi:hypothetical protein